MQKTSWFDADMCAALGAIFYQINKNVNKINLINICSGVRTILTKNGFLSYYGHERTPDTFGTTIQYQRFDIKDDRYFADYIKNELLSRPELPKMSEGLQKKFHTNICEIFSNAVLHSHTELGVFSCGQFYPAHKELVFSVVDLGVGIQKNVQDYIGLDISPEEAIEWAMTKPNTTKKGCVPGGIGLKELRVFIGLNGGCLQIVSDAGYWELDKSNTVITRRLNQPFPGTIVTLKINTDDIHSYALSSEITASNIF